MKLQLMKSMLLLLVLCCSLHAQEDNLLEQADAAFRDGDQARSAGLAQRVLARNPRAVHAHMILGVIAAQKKDWITSNRHFRTVVSLEPSNPFGYFYLGQAKLYQQDWGAAIRYFSDALKREYPERERLLVELALAQNESGHPEQALASLEGISPSADDGLSAQYYAVTAFARGKLNQPAQAAEAIRQALRFDSSNVQYWEFLIGLLLKNDEAPLALAEAIRAQQKFPDDADIQFLFTLASYHVTESPLSKLALRNLREADPKSPRVLLAEGLLYRKQAKTEEATQAFKLAAKAGVNDAHLLLGIVYKENGDYEASERECREAERLNPESGQVLLELGKLLLNRGDLEEARTRLEKALFYMPDAASVHYQLGLLYRRLGQAEKAQEHFRKSKQPEMGLR
jgi:tetratricopeptide (TPR) repeat protein